MSSQKKEELRTAQVIKSRLKELRMSAAELSRASGVPNSTISQWLSGAVPKNPSQVKAAAIVLKVSTHFFYWGEEEARTSQSLDEFPRTLEPVLSGYYHITISKVSDKK